MNQGILHQYKNCIIDIIQDEDEDFLWYIERLYISNSMFKVLDGIHFESIEDAIEDGEELADYFLSNLNKFKDSQEFILAGINKNSDFIVFETYLEKRKSDFCNYLSWRLRKTK